LYISVRMEGRKGEGNEKEKEKEKQNKKDYTSSK
jgi:hypothetical protein